MSLASFHLSLEDITIAFNPLWFLTCPPLWLPFLTWIPSSQLINLTYSGDGPGLGFVNDVRVGRRQYGSVMGRNNRLIFDESSNHQPPPRSAHPIPIPSSKTGGHQPPRGSGVLIGHPLDHPSAQCLIKSCRRLV
jgi:hypothetical protein